MHRTRGVLIRNFGRRQDPGVDDPRLEIHFSYVSIIVHFLPAMLALKPSMLINSIHIGHDTI